MGIICLEKYKMGKAMQELQAYRSQEHFQHLGASYRVSGEKGALPTSQTPTNDATIH
jgi:hypothetical protein